MSAGRRKSSSMIAGDVARAALEANDSFKKEIDFERYLKEVMRAYLNLELSGCTMHECSALAAALKTNASVTAVNLSCCAEVNDASLAILVEGFAVNETVCLLNLSACRLGY